MSVVMEGVREIQSKYPVELVVDCGHLCVKATCHGGFATTTVDIEDVIRWVRANRPDLLEEH